MMLLDQLRADVRYALRTFAKSKAFTATAIATLALGIGANAAVFSVVDALLLRELPVRNPGELVFFDWLRTPDSMIAGYSGYGRIGPIPGTTVRTSFPTLALDRFRARTGTFAHVFGFTRAGLLNVVADKQTDTAAGLFVTGNYYEALGVRAHIGRTISSLDDRQGAEPVAVISHRYWQRRFGSDPAVVGKTIAINRAPITIVGVTPESFHGVYISESADLTLPVATNAGISGLRDNGMAYPPWMWWMQMMARLQPGVTREQVLADLQGAFVETVRESWAMRPPDTINPARTGIPQLRVQPGAQGPDGPRIDAQQVLIGVFAVVAAVLLIGCANVATLMLVRATARRHEVSVRLTLGASRGRVVRQLLTESVLLALAGGLAGAVLAWWGKDFMLWLPARDVPVVDSRLDLRVLAFMTIVSAATAVASGLGPAWRATREDFGPALRSSALKGGTPRSMAARALLVAQVAVSLLLIAGAGLFVRTVYSLSREDVGYDADNLLAFRVNPALPGENSGPPIDLYERLVAAIESAPGVRTATLTVLPMIGGGEWDMPVRADRGGDPRDTFIHVVRWNFFEAMGIPLIAGRALSADDTADRPRVAVINQTLARQLFGDGAPLGRSLQFVRGPYRDVRLQVVGIVRDSKYGSLQRRPAPTLFMSYPQISPLPRGMTVEVRTVVDPVGVASAIRAAVQQVDTELPLIGMRTERQRIGETIGKPRAFALLTTVAAALALLLACVGLYGIASYDAARRTNEIGIRMALGARRSDVLRLVMRQTIIVVTIGAAIGLAAALAASRLIRALLFGVTPTDPAALASAVAVLVAVAVVAAYLPARRAVRLDPTEALRYE